MTRTIAARHGTALHVSSKCVHKRTYAHTHNHTHANTRTCTRRYAEENGKANIAKLHKNFYSMVSIKLWPLSTVSRSDYSSIRFNC